MKHLRILNYVDEVARAGSIRKAADRLNVTASAVNRRIADLEDELGTPLFDRRPRGVRLTAAGEVFVHYLRGQNGEVERMKSQIEDLKGLRRGTVRIACSQALALDFLPRQIAEFRNTHPLVSFDLQVVDHEWAMAALAAYEVDLVMVFRPPFLANFQPLMTLEQQLVVVMAKDHPLAWRRMLRLSDCAGLSGRLALALDRRPAIVGRGFGANRADLQDRRRIELVRNAARAGRSRRTDFVSNSHRRIAGRQQAWPDRPRNRRPRRAARQSRPRAAARAHFRSPPLYSLNAL